MALPAPRSRAGFVLYVALPTDGPGASVPATTLADVAESLRELALDALPGADSVTALSLVPDPSGDVGRLGDRLTHLRVIAGGAAPARSGDTG